MKICWEITDSVHKQTLIAVELLTDEDSKQEMVGDVGDEGKRETERRTTSNKRQQTTQLTQQFRWVCENLLFLPASPSTNPSLLLTDSFYVGKQNLFTPNPKLCSTMGILALALDNANVCRGRRRRRRRRKKKEHKRKKQLELSGKSEKIWKHFEGVQHEIFCCSLFLRKSINILYNILYYDIMQLLIRILKLVFLVWDYVNVSQQHFVAIWGVCIL